VNGADNQAEISPAEWAQHAKIPAEPMFDGLLAMNKAYDLYGFSGGNSFVLEAILAGNQRQ
jgi:hypothetical protein